MTQARQTDTLTTTLADVQRRLAALEGHSPQVFAVYDRSGQLRFIGGQLDRLGGAYIGTYGAAVLDATGTIIWHSSA